MIFPTHLAHYSLAYRVNVLHVQSRSDLLSPWALRLTLPSLSHASKFPCDVDAACQPAFSWNEQPSDEMLCPLILNKSADELCTITYILLDLNGKSGRRIVKSVTFSGRWLVIFLSDEPHSKDFVPACHDFLAKQIFLPIGSCTYMDMVTAQGGRCKLTSLPRDTKR
jgi:hypothetical protein